MSKKIPVNYALGSLVRDSRVGRELAARIIKERMSNPFENPQDLVNRVEGIDLHMAETLFNYKLKSQISNSSEGTKNGPRANRRKFASNKAEALAQKRRECKDIQSILKALYSEDDQDSTFEKLSVVEIFRANVHLIACDKCSAIYSQKSEKEENKAPQ